MLYIHGIGLTQAKNICVKAKVDEDKRVRKDLTDNQVVAIRDAITALEIRVEGEQRTQVSMNIKRKRDIGCYQGVKTSSRSTSKWPADKNKLENTQRLREELSDSERKA